MVEPAKAAVSSVFRGAHPLPSLLSAQPETDMGNEDIAAGKVKQVKGKLNDIAGALKGDTAQQIKGKVQKAVGKAQEALGKATKPEPAPRDSDLD
jgi:uncharacterized protein YjbJ (UPF0337 family)